MLCARYVARLMPSLRAGGARPARGSVVRLNPVGATQSSNPRCHAAPSTASAGAIGRASPRGCPARYFTALLARRSPDRAPTIGAGGSSPPAGCGPCADGTSDSVMSAGWAVLAAEVDDLEMDCPPAVLGKQLFEVT